jgi:hypothetical protein
MRKYASALAIGIASFCFAFPALASASVLFTWPSYSGGSASINTDGTYNLTGVSDVIIHSDSENANLGAGGIDGTFPYDNLNNTIYANFGATTTSGWVCFTSSGLGGAPCGTDATWNVYWSGSVTGYASSSMPGFTISSTTIATSTPTHTEIVSVNPVNGSTIATSTAATIGAVVWVDPLQWTQDLSNNLGPYTLTIQVIPATAAQVAAPPGAVQSLYPKYTFTVENAGYSYFSTTTNASDSGTYQMQTEFTKSQTWYGQIFSWLSFGIVSNSNILDSTSTSFNANKSLTTAIFSASTTEAIANLLASSTATLTTLSNECIPGLGFNIGDCFALIFVPDTQALGGWFQAFRSQFLSYAPWGYATRFITILTTSSTSSSPVISLTFPVGSYGHTSNTDTFTINMDSSMQAGSALLNGVTSTWNGKTQNFQQILEPPVDTIIGITLLIFIATDVLGLFNSERRRPKEKLR